MTAVALQLARLPASRVSSASAVLVVTQPPTWARPDQTRPRASSLTFTFLPIISTSASNFHERSSYLLVHGSRSFSPSSNPFLAPTPCSEDPAHRHSISISIGISFSFSMYPGRGHGPGGHHGPPPGQWGAPPPQQGYGYQQGPPQPNYANYPPPQQQYPPQHQYPPQQQQHYQQPPPQQYGGGQQQQGYVPQGQQRFGHGAPDSYNFQYSQCTGKRKALLIGINYFGSANELKGCINDVTNVSNFLMERYNYKREDMVILTDNQSNPVLQPTKDNILRAMDWLVKGAQANDALFLHYSGMRGLPFLSCLFISQARKMSGGIVKLTSMHSHRPRRTNQRS